MSELIFLICAIEERERERVKREREIAGDLKKYKSHLVGGLCFVESNKINQSTSFRRKSKMSDISKDTIRNDSTLSDLNSSRLPVFFHPFRLIVNGK